MRSFKMESTVGERLKNLRLEKGLTLEEAHRQTKLHLNILRAIEEDNLINFNPVYLRGFLKIYCRFLGVDQKDYIPDYKEPKNIVKRKSDIPEKSASLFKISFLKPLFLKVTRIKPKTIFIIIIIFFFIIGLFNLGKVISSKRSLFSKKAKLSVVATSKPKLESKIEEPKPQNIPIAIAKIIRLDIRAKENCFIQVKADGKVIFQNILKKGRAESWQAKDKIELSLGNAGVVELEVNGKRLSNLGKRGQALKNILITKEGLDIKR